MVFPPNKQFAGQLRDSEKGGRAEIHVIDEGQKVPDDEDQEKLQAVLPFEKQDQVNHTITHDFCKIKLMSCSVLLGEAS